jgi:hypothetical protein
VKGIWRRGNSLYFLKTYTKKWGIGSLNPTKPLYLKLEVLLISK